jgi:CubicO group peptidase (beta-lactamase class C family)
MNRHDFCALVFALAVLGWPTTLPAQESAGGAKELQDFDSFITETMKDWKVPGLAVAIVKEGKVVLSKGYGARDREKNLPVTPRTIFAVGSITKSFTAATLAGLASAGKFEWDNPVRDYWPEFRMMDDVMTSRVTPRDLVTHRTGLPRHDAIWYNSSAARDQLLQHLRHLEASKDLRAQAQYNNLMFLAAGYLAGKLNGTTWETAATQTLLQPLGMTRTNFSVADSQKADDYSQPYEKDEKEVVHLIPFRNIDTIAPAGSINSSIEDMTQYLLMYLNKGKAGERQVISEANIGQMTRPQMVWPTALIDPEMGYGSYGMGLFVTTYRGHIEVQHGGNIDGFSAYLTFLPQENLGAVVLSNLNGTRCPQVIAYGAYDRLLGLPPSGLGKRWREREKAAEAAEKEAKSRGYVPRVADTKPSHALAVYPGEYENPGYGIVTITQDGDKLKITFNNFTSALQHFHYDVFAVPENRLDRLERTKVMFNTGWNGDIESLSIPFEPAVKDIVFKRLPDRKLRDPKSLERFTGTYLVGDVPFVITLRGDDALEMREPNGTLRELVPVRARTFNVKGLSGHRIEFQTDAAGVVAEAAMTSPDGTVVAKRKP